MKILVICICLLQDTCPLKGHQGTKELQHIFLKLMFPPFYNSYNKSCCKMYPGRCYKLLDSSGYTCDSLRGRVTTTEKNGWIEFEISNVQVDDAGYYRCGVLGTQTQIYADYYVEVFASDHNGQSQPPLTTTATVRAPNSSTTVLDLTEPVLVQDHGDNDRASWNFGVLLFVAVSITAMISVASVLGAVCCKVKAKCKKSKIFGETLCESWKQEARETSGIIYATVDFKPHQKPEEVYANLGDNKSGAGIPDADNAGMVEYSMLAIQL
ncbi:hypothetical protein CHARACLAT_021797 [Characodon lateralis]|uniref:Uncharacterized protein n=1 Tax=Characodon lateralis TaxID=208331 RepID=A0ABU7DIP9_9TELE|nr:hypothetical protein [Characodon lateralis]